MSRVLATHAAQGIPPLHAQSLGARPLPAGLDPARMPSHVAVIMDGNGRWAKQIGRAHV